MLVWETYAATKGKKFSEVEITFEDVIFKKSLEIRRDPILRLTVTISSASGAFEVLEDEDVLATGYVKEEKLSKTNEKSCSNFEENSVIVEKEDFYTELLQAGHEYVDPLTAVKKVKINLKSKAKSLCIIYNKARIILK